jgi:hypothetical protein
MPIFYPDILENNNPNYPLVDATFLKGNAYPLAELADTGSIPTDKRRVGLIVFTSGSQEWYGYKGQDVSGWDTPSNWEQIGAGGGSTDYISNVAYDTGSISFTGVGSAFDGVISINALTSSLVSNSQTSSFVTNNETGSFYYSSSVNLNTVTFYQGDGTTENVTVDTGSVGTLQTVTDNGNTTTNDIEISGSLDVTGSFSMIGQSTFTSLNNLSSPVVIEPGVGSPYGSLYMTTYGTAGTIAEFNQSVISINSSYTLGSLKFSKQTSTWGLIKAQATNTNQKSVISLTANGTSTPHIEIDGENDEITINNTVLAPDLANTTTPHIVGYDTASGELTYYGTGSFGGGSTDISALNAFTGSIQTEVDSLTAATSSYLTGEDTGSFLYSGSFDSNTSNIRLYSKDQNYDLDLSGLAGGSGGLPITASYTGSVLTQNVKSFDFEGNGVKATNVGSAVTVTVTQVDTGSFVTNDQTSSLVTNDETGSFYISSSVNLNTITSTQGDGTTESVTVDTGSGVAGTLQTVTDNGNKTTNGIDIAKLYISGSDNSSLVVDVKNLDLSSSFQIYNNGVVAAYGKGGNTTNVALGENTTGTVGVLNTTLIGGSAGQSNTGTTSTIVGGYAGQTNTGNEAVIVGYLAGQNNTGARATLIGERAGKENTGGYSTFVGAEAGEKNAGQENVGLGYLALHTGSGTQNTAVGVVAGWETVKLTGNKNTFLGYNASYGTNTSITNATAIGADVTLAQSNTVILGNNANVGIGTSTPGATLHTTGSISGSGNVYFDALPNTVTPNIVGFDTTTGELTYYSTGSFGGGTNTGSLMVTGSVSNNVLSFEKGDGSTFSLTVDTGSAPGNDTEVIYNKNGHFHATASFTFNDNGVSGQELVINGTKVNENASLKISGSDSSYLSIGKSLIYNNVSSNFSSINHTFLASGNTLSWETDDNNKGPQWVLGDRLPNQPQISGSNFTIVPGYTNDRDALFRVYRTPSLNNWVETFSVSSSGEVYMPELDNTTTPHIVGYDSTTGELTYYSTGSFGSGGGSINTGSFYISSSVSLNTITFTQGDGTTESVTVDTGSAVAIDTGSLLTTGSVNNTTLTFTKGDGTTFDLTVTGSNIYNTDGTLTANRTVGAGPGATGKNLTFEFQNANFIINSDPARQVQINNLDTTDTPRVVGYADGVLTSMSTSSFKPGGPVNTFQFNKNNAFSGSSLFFDSVFERVGIGESSPDRPLHITDTNAVAIKLERTDAPEVGIQFFGNGASGGGAIIRGLNNDFEVIQRDTATSANERNLYISASGEVYAPRLKIKPTSNIVYYNDSTGEIVYNRNVLRNVAAPTGSVQYTTGGASATTSSFVSVAGTIRTNTGESTHASPVLPQLSGKTLGTDAFITATWADPAEAGAPEQFCVLNSISGSGQLLVDTGAVGTGRSDAIIFQGVVLI